MSHLNNYTNTQFSVFEDQYKCIQRQNNYDSISQYSKLEDYDEYSMRLENSKINTNNLDSKKNHNETQYSKRFEKIPMVGLGIVFGTIIGLSICLLTGVNIVFSGIGTFIGLTVGSVLQLHMEDSKYN